MISGRAFRSIVRTKVSQLLAWKIWAKPAMLNPFVQAAFRKITVHVVWRNTASALVWIVRAFPAIVPAEPRLCNTHDFSLPTPFQNACSPLTFQS